MIANRGDVQSDDRTSDESDGRMSRDRARAAEKAAAQMPRSGVSLVAVLATVWLAGCGNAPPGESNIAASSELATDEAPAADAIPAIDVDGGVDDGTGFPTGQLAPEDPPPGAIELDMSLDCAALDGDAAAYATKNGLCPGGTGVAVPENTRWGNCGASWIYVSNRRSGNAYVWWGFLSTLGTVVYRNLNAHWANYSRGTAGGFLDKNYMFSSSYTNDRVFKTAAGEVAVALSGSVRLVWGGSCTILIPTASATITW